MSNLRDIFDLTGAEFDLAEAYWELRHSTGDPVTMHPAAFAAFVCSARNMLRWADDGGFYAVTHRGIVVVRERR